jgi:3-phosphoshikimate 1-carboxyvinyltransferase
MMPTEVEIQTTGPVVGAIRPPGSKSITNRALVCAALSAGTSRLRGALDSEDTRVMIDALRQLGIEVRASDDRTELTVAGCGGRLPASQADLFLANSGTSIRFLTALCTLGAGRYRLDGIPRMRQRPIEDLLQTLRALGADAVAANGDGCPPVVVAAAGLPGGSATVRGNISSQFLSALLMAAPCAAGDVCLIVDGQLVSQPYVRMTLAVMESFGIHVDGSRLDRFQIGAGRRYQACDYAVEPDASAASYFWAAAAITGGSVTVHGLSRQALQGDVAFCDCLQAMGCQVQYADDRITVAGRPLRGVSVDMNAISDTVQTLAAVALYADGPTTITGVPHIRYKETDRIGDLARELRKLGAEVQELPDGLRIVPGPLRAAAVDTYNDHRMAMSLALVGLRTPGVVICNPQCTEKTYPRFFDDLRDLCRSSSQVEAKTP